MEKLNNKKRLLFASLLFLAGVVVFLFLILGGEQKKEEAENGLQRERKEEKKAEVRTEKEKKEITVEGLSPKESPVEVINFGWRPVSRTIPSPGFIWEWAVELENKTPLYIKTLVKFELLDDEGKIVGKGYGGWELQADERRIIIGRASSSDEILQTKRIRVTINISPSRANSPEEISEFWKWEDPFKIIKERELSFKGAEEEGKKGGMWDNHQQ